MSLPVCTQEFMGPDHHSMAFPLDSTTWVQQGTVVGTHEDCENDLLHA